MGYYHRAKAPIGPHDWALIDGHLVDGIIRQGEIDQTLIKIQGSGYDSKQLSGYIACRDLASEVWVKKLISSITGGCGGYRAWAKGEKPTPEAVLCRLFLPARFDKLNEAAALRQLVRFNPEIKLESLAIKKSEPVQGGRAIHLEMDLPTYL